MEPTDPQVAARLDRTLNAIWRLGDRDEASIKHIGHGLAAILAGKDWRDAIDYRRPWSQYDEPPAWKEKNLSDRWEKVLGYREQIGAERLHAIVVSVPVATYAQTYYEDYWRK
jgi:hypothetical protein